jgi:hypothetical protein
MKSYVFIKFLFGTLATSFLLSNAAYASERRAPVYFPQTAVMFYTYVGQANESGEIVPTKSELLRAELKIRPSLDVDCAHDERVAKIGSENSAYIIVGVSAKNILPAVTFDPQTRLIKATGEAECEVRFERRGPPQDGY